MLVAKGITMPDPGELPDTFVPASTIAHVTKSHFRKIRMWAQQGLIGTQQAGGARVLYSLRDAHKLIASSQTAGAKP